MPRGQEGLERTAKPSVLDRLVDLSPREGADPVLSREESEHQYRLSVLRDLEWLLNTRRTTTTVPDSLPELQTSVFSFGLPDLSSLSADDAETRQALIRQVEQAIRRFEPRLMDIRVSLAPSDEAERLIHFTIEGLLKMEPNPERVVFDTVMEIANGDFSVSSPT